MVILLSDNKQFRASWPVALMMFLIASPLFAQVIPTGTISGVVKDPSGLAVANASVTAVNAESNAPRTTTTGDDGAYRFPALPVGQYNVRVKIAGYETEIQMGVTLDIAQEAVVNFALEVGSVEQQVLITSEVPRVDTTSSSLGHLIDSKQISELPLNGRNFVDLTLMQTGVTQFQNNNFGTNGLFGQFYSSNGAPLRSNFYTLDGAIMGNIQAASASSIAGLSLGLDGISEYKVMTNTFGAEYGLAMGSQTTIVTKGGTNRFHGDAYEYIRNSVLDARNYFDLLYTLPSTTPGGGRRIAPFKRNQFGGAIGGPIKKDKTFFFATYEGFREVMNNPPNVGVTPTIPAACHTPVVSGVQTVTNACDSALAANATENVSPIDGSLREIEYALDTLKADGIGVLTSYGDKWLGDSAFAPVFEELNRRKAVVFTHANVPSCCTRGGSGAQRYLVPGVNNNVIEYGTDTTRAIMSLVVINANERYPNIRFTFSHAGGTMPFLIERILGRKEMASLTDPTRPNARLHQLRQFYYDTANANNVVAMTALKKVVGSPQILFGTDFPYEGPVAEQANDLKTCGAFTAEELQAIYYDNARRLLSRLSV